MEEDKIKEAEAVLAEANKAKAEECAKELEALLDKYGMTLQVSQPQFMLVPKK